jgi:hypothetical protein
LADWIRQNGRAVDPALWRSSGGLAASPEEGANPNAGAVLYDLRPEPDGGS